MRKTTCFLTLGVVLFATPVFAEINRCEKISKSLSERWGPDVACQCGPELSNLEVTVPIGTHLEAVCGLRGNNGKLIDLRKTKATLDKYDSSGSYPSDGVIYISGELVLTGLVVVEPSNCCTMSFRPKLLNVPRESVFSVPKQSVFTENYLTGIRMDVDYDKFRAPDPTYVECLTANATIKIRGLEVRLIGNDEGGTYPRDLDVLKVSAFKKCGG